MFEDFQNYIECVDPVYSNPRDTGKIVFKCKGDPAVIIKWCRRNFGDRGDGWDFNGGKLNVEIVIWSKRLITMYELWQN